MILIHHAKNIIQIDTAEEAWLKYRNEPSIIDHNLALGLKAF